MKYAIIAAGNGSRLHQEGVKVPKPLVKINGERLIDRLFRIFCNNQATEIIVICNEQMTDVQEHLADVQQHGLNGKEVPLRFIVKTTPSSMHSFYEISSLIGKESFVLTTVDTIFREDEFSVYIHEFQKEIEDGTQAFMGVTDYIDDEKPLYVSTDEAMNIIGFHDKNTGNCQYISGGIYGLTPETITTLNNCMERGESRMRNFQRALIANGRKTKAYAFTKVLDIDHATDIEKAEEYLKP
ncbi:sugar phosphate nucleotidyltransferase [Prevotella disiens]|uniref:Nucleoside-diphosphate-sugar pyrophosphorylase n=1 Tax=Prevotella disiens DNF00882 TaxID=1401075 RepID=A0A096AJF9_9BACT|nr:NDP-sugar synthase [Prevotella disiens]KGF47233.1 nucleoside-diphosphate-sugar pyrophosphorylase [Prevotella disiens DNF00882]